jgi:glycosyltransferase involved in cell wall biosynthesis
MKVLFVINSLGAGGSERSLAEMLPPLAARGVHPTVACLKRASEGVAGEIVTAGFDVRFLRGRSLPAWAFELRRIIRAEQPDVVHTALFEADIAGRLAALGTRAAVVTSLVNTTYDRARLADPRVRRTRLATVRLLDAWTARHLTHDFHAVTEAVKRSSVAHLRIAPDRVTVIARGRDPGRLGAPSPQRRRQVRGRLGLSEAHEVIVNVGRQEFQKGQRHLVEAVGGLGNRPRLVLLQAGRRGHVSEELVEAVHHSGVAERVRFLGHREDVADLLAAADLFAFPSIYEGLGGAVIEALALGLPVVASDLPALREVLEPDRNALLVEPGNPNELACAIAQLLDDPARARAFGARSQEIFEQRFDLDRSVKRSVELYRRVTAGQVS